MITRLFGLVCDGCGGQAPGGTHRNAIDARKAAEMRGWVRLTARSGRHPGGARLGRDLCPPCYSRKPEGVR